MWGKWLLVLLLSFVLYACGNDTHTVEITYVSNGGNAISTVQINSDSPQWHPTIPVKAGYWFVNWYVDEVLTEVYTYQHLTENKRLTLYARYVSLDDESQCVVTFVTAGGTYVPRQLVACGETVSEPPNPSQGNLMFSGWSYYDEVEGMDKPFDFSTPIIYHMSLYAQFE